MLSKVFAACRANFITVRSIGSNRKQNNYFGNLLNETAGSSGQKDAYAWDLSSHNKSTFVLIHAEVS